MQPTINQKIAAFFMCYPLKTFTRRQLLLSPDDSLTAVFYLAKGRVSQYDITSSGNEIVVNVFKPGAFFPMSMALNDTKSDYFFEASLEVDVHVVPVEDAVQFLHDNPDVALDLLRRVYRGTDGVLRRMVYLMSGDAKARLMFELLNAGNRFGDIRSDGSIYVQLNESDIAKHAGLARETVSRHMQALKVEGLLEVVSRGIVLRDIRALESLLEEGKG